MRPAYLLFLVAVVLPGCATRDRRSPPVDTRDRSGLAVPEAPPALAKIAPADSVAAPSGVDPVMARYEGRDIRASEVGQWFLRTHRREALASLSKLIGLEIVEREAKKIGLHCPGALLEARRGEILQRLERDAAVVYGIGTPTARYVRLRFQQELEDHMNILVEQVRQRWLFSRIIRLHGIQAERVELAMIVLKDRATAEEVSGKLDEGADFERLAARYSIHESGQHGGRLPPLPREALNPAVARHAFALKEGDRTGVLDVDDGRGVRQFEIVRLLRRSPARDVTWATVAAEIEAGLLERPVDATEWAAWYLRLERLYRVRVVGNL